MEEIFRAIELLSRQVSYSKRLVIALTKDSIKKLIKRQIELGISENANIDFNKNPIGYFAGYPVEDGLYNAVMLTNDYEILVEIRLSDNLSLEE